MTKEIVPVAAPKFWLPRLSQKQLSVFNDFHRFLLLSGPRKSSKSWANCHKIVRHAYDVPNAEIIMVSRNIKTAKEGGIWSYLVDQVIPEWFAAGLTKYVKPPHQDGQTRTLGLSLVNRYGGTSKIMLNSLDFDDGAEALFKERAFSMIYFSELSKWRKRKVFDVSILSLRKPGIPYNQMQWLADTNPGDLGENEWYYKLFWTERLMEGVPEYCKTPDSIAKFRKRQQEMNVVEIFLNENPFLSQEEIDDVIASHMHDPDQYARYVEGRYVTASGDGFFSNVFKHDVHVLGDTHHPNRGDWEILFPPADTQAMQIGYDLGDRNSAIVFTYKAQDEKRRNEYYVLDEIIVQNDEVSIDALTEEVLRIMDKWNNYLGREIQYAHYSDTSSFNKKLSASDTEAMLVHNISNGRITLNPVTKYSGSVNDGITLMRRLLFEKRLFFSANCLHTINMMKSLKPDRARGTGVQKVPDNIHTHPYDALRYVLSSVEPHDLAIRRPRTQKAGRIISLR